MTASGSRPIEITVLHDCPSVNNENSRPSFNSIRNPLDSSGGSATTAAAAATAPLKLNENDNRVGLTKRDELNSGTGDDRLDFVERGSLSFSNGINAERKINRNNMFLLTCVSRNKWSIRTTGGQ
jgi:hypothetical protein